VGHVHGPLAVDDLDRLQAPARDQRRRAVRALDDGLDLDAPELCRNSRRATTVASRSPTVRTTSIGSSSGSSGASAKPIARSRPPPGSESGMFTFANSARNLSSASNVRLEGGANLKDWKDGQAMNVLLMESEPGVADQVARLLDQAAAETFTVVRAGRISAGMERLLREQFDCVVLDLGTPIDLDMDVVDRVLLTAQKTPVVVLSDEEAPELALHAIRAGAQEFAVTGELTPAALRRHVRHSVERRRIQAGLAHQALHDGLTALPNRLLFLDRMRQAVSRLGRTQTCLAVLFIDLDDFKAVNDRAGHEAGDDLLASVGRVLASTLRGGDTAARIGGDEFAVLCEDVTGEAHARRIAERVLDGLPAPASIGIALASRGDEDTKLLLRDADLAMYEVKRRAAEAPASPWPARAHRPSPEP
jgi:diguanylate cyclase (GGDEF)-like protein